MALITRETAREMAARGNARKREILANLRVAAHPVPLPRDDSYVERRLARVREQLLRLDGFLDSEDDPGKIDRLASAIARLSEIERVLAGRPTPGQRKPKEEVAVNPNAAVAWLADSIDVHQVAPPAAPAGPVAPTEPPADTPTGSVQPENPLPETPSP